MYVAYDGKDIIAFHEDKEVIEIYCDIIDTYHNIKLGIYKVKKKEAKKFKDFEDLYLVRYGETYIQQGYVDYMQFSSQQLNEDHVQARDILKRVLKTANLDKEESKSIKKTINILNDIIEDDSLYIPELSSLKRMKLEYDPYRYNYNIWN